MNEHFRVNDCSKCSFSISSEHGYYCVCDVAFPHHSKRSLFRSLTLRAIFDRWSGLCDKTDCNSSCPFKQPNINYMCKMQFFVRKLIKRN